jgi:hypothetical protein
MQRRHGAIVAADMSNPAVQELHDVRPELAELLLRKKEEILRANPSACYPVAALWEV